MDGKTAPFAPEVDSALLVSISKLEESDYNLSADRYREVIRVGKQTHKMVALEDVCERIADNIDPTQFSGDVKYVGLENIESNTGELVGEVNSTYEIIKSAKTRFAEGDILYGKLRPNLNKVYLAQFSGICSTDIFVLRTKQNAEKSYIREILRSLFFNTEVLKGLGGAQLPRVSFDYLSTLKIPLPPLETQRQLVDEIAAHQRIIDGARQVVEGWKPDIEFDSSWEIKNIADLNIHIGDGNYSSAYPKASEYADKKTGIPFLTALNLKNGTIEELNIKYITKEKHRTLKKGQVKPYDIVIVVRGSNTGNVSVIPESLAISNTNSQLAFFRTEEKELSPLFLFYLLASKQLQQQIKLLITGSAQPQLPIKNIMDLNIPLPPLDIQREIVARIETERAIVHGNRELIRLYEEKVKKVIERVWEG